MIYFNKFNCHSASHMSYIHIFFFLFTLSNNWFLCIEWRICFHTTYVIRNKNAVISRYVPAVLQINHWDSNFPLTRPFSQLSVLMSLLTAGAHAYRPAKKSPWKPIKQKKRESEREHRRRYSDQFNATILPERALARVLCYTPTPVTGETRRGFPCGRVRMRVQNTLHRIAKRDGRWCGGCREEEDEDQRDCRDDEGKGSRETDWLRICMPKPFLLIGGSGGGLSAFS